MKHSLLLSLVLFLCGHASLRGQELVVTSDHASGVYAVGEDVKWTVAYKANSTTAPAAPADLKITLKSNGHKVVREASVPMTDGQAVIEAKLDAPGTMLLSIEARLVDKTIKGFGGAVADPAKIDRSSPRPDDFDAFWQSQIDKLNAIAPGAKLTPGESGVAGVEYSKITLDNVNNSKVNGQIARPAGDGKKFPAMLIVQWAGVYPLQKPWVIDRAKEGWLAMNIIAHDLPIDEPVDYYKKLADGDLKDYRSQNNDDREKSYFLRMYLSCYRAADYLTTRDDWDGRTFVVSGGSQGGLQAIMTAAIHPKVTAVLANVPAGCDLTGPMVDRACGWPNWYFATKGRDEARVRETGKYFDVMNFASRVKVPTLVSAGLLDTTCPPSGVIATFNQLAGPKELVIMPQADHGKRHEPYYERQKAWQAKLLKGEQPPVKD